MAGDVVLSVMVAVPDGPAAARWYRDALGANERWDLGSVVGLEIGGAAFFLPAGTGRWFDAPATPGSTTTRIEVVVDDPDAMVERAVAAGAVGDPVVEHATPWGVHRQGEFRDPVGHMGGVGDRSPLSQHR